MPGATNAISQGGVSIGPATMFDFPAAKVTWAAAGTQSLTNNTVTDLTGFDQTVNTLGQFYDTWLADEGVALWDQTLQRFNIPLKGIWTFSLCVVFAANVSNGRGAAVQINNNGSRVESTLVQAQGNVAIPSAVVNLSVDMFCDAGDFAEPKGFQGSGGALNVIETDSNTGGKTRFMCSLKRRLR